MRKVIDLPIAATAVVMALAVVVLTPLQRSSAQTPAPEEPRAADAAPVPYNPTMGDLMNLLIQPRHVKLWYAGKQENWPLAGYALKEIRQSLARITASVPHYNGAPVADLIETAMHESMTLIDFAIKAGEPRQFVEQYAKLTAGCNACHVSTGHPYIVLKTPDGEAFANQEFEPKR
jgi:hypothetical protein